MSVIWSPQALDDVAAAVDYLVEHHAADAAVKLIDRITTLVERLASEPIEGPEHLLKTGERVRGWPCPPFRIYYQRAGDTLLVLRVYDQRQTPPREMSAKSVHRRGRDRNEVRSTRELVARVLAVPDDLNADGQ